MAAVARESWDTGTGDDPEVAIRPSFEDLVSRVVGDVETAIRTDGQRGWPLRKNTYPLGAGLFRWTGSAG
jgi:hypothetical protein